MIEITVWVSMLQADCTLLIEDEQQELYAWALDVLGHGGARMKKLPDASVQTE